MKHTKSMIERLHLGINPIAIKKLCSRMRGTRAFAVLTGVLLLLAGVSYTLYRVVMAMTPYWSVPVSPEAGQTLFTGLALTELLMVCFVTPAIAAGGISGEQERLPSEMLPVAPLRPARILWGKLIAALGCVFLLILAAVPITSLAFVYGGIAPADMLKALVVLLATAITVDVIAVFASAWLRHTARATTISYLATLGLLIGPILLYRMAGVLMQGQSSRWLLVPSPISALFSALAMSSPYGKQVSFLSELGYMLGSPPRIALGGMFLPHIPRPLYHYTLVLYGGLSLVLYLLAIRLVRSSRR
jgi:ABC-2 type transport system permease protein